VLNLNGTGGYERYLLTGTDTYLKQQVGILSRLTPLAPLERSDARADYPVDNASACGPSPPGSTGISKHYVARLPLVGEDGVAATLVVLGLHLKAIPTQPKSCQQREGQAAVAQQLLAAALEETDLVVVLGDLNDFDGDACCLDAGSSTPTSRVLRMLKNPRAAAADELHAVAARLPKAERYTDWWDHAPDDGIDNGVVEHSSLDHMLVSSTLFDALQTVRIDHTHKPMDVSDHWPIIASFDLSARLGVEQGPDSAHSPPVMVVAVACVVSVVLLGGVALLIRRQRGRPATRPPNADQQVMLESHPPRLSSASGAAPKSNVPKPEDGACGEEAEARPDVESKASAEPEEITALVSGGAKSDQIEAV